MLSTVVMKRSLYIASDIKSQRLLGGWHVKNYRAIKNKKQSWTK